MSSSMVSSSKTIYAPLSKALAILHDPPQLARLNPLVTEVTQSSEDPNFYTITDKLVVLGIPLGTQSYIARFTFNEDGVDTDVQASGGVKLKNQWRVEQKGDAIEVTETVVVYASALLKRYVISTLKNSHKELLDALAKQLEGDNTSRLVLNTQSGSQSPKRLLLPISSMAAVLAAWSALFNDDHSWRRLVYIAIAISVVIVALASYTGDPYGSYHDTLNVRPGDDPIKRPDTEWLNMGYWKDTLVFREACQALALRVIRASRCIPGGHVLDVGHACGDSLLLHLRHPDVPRPASLTGITSLPSQHKRSRERIATHQSSTNGPRCAVMLFCGDAIFRPRDSNHPLNAGSSSHPFTTIIALDCAYHFASRKIFLRQCFARLSPGGSIALGDLLVSEPLPFGLRTFLSRLLSVRSENMVTPAEYKQQLETIGYENVRLQDVSENVFPGFCLFLKSKGGLWRIMELVISWWVQAGGRFMIVSASKPKTLAVSGLNS